MGYEWDGYEMNGYKERKMLRVYGPLVEQGIWGIRTNEKLKELYKELDKITNIKRERFEWTGYVVRMEKGSAIKKIFGIFLLLHRACCRVTQLLHQPLHIYKIYKIYTLKH